MSIFLLLRNFFYAVGLVILGFMYTDNPKTATFGDLVWLTQSHNAQHLVVAITSIFVGLQFITFQRISSQERKQLDQRMHQKINNIIKENEQ